MRRLLLAAALAALTLSGCAAIVPTEATTTPVTYGCKAGKRFTAVYPAKGAKVIVVAGGVTKTLPLARSGSGARYQKGGFQIWSKGPSAVLAGFPGGPYDDCQAR